MDRVQLLGYPSTPTDASIQISELRSSDTGVYRCEVQHDIEDNHDIIHVQVQGMQISSEKSVTQVSEVNVVNSTDLKVFCNLSPLIGCQIHVGMVYLR